MDCELCDEAYLNVAFHNHMRIWVLMERFKGGRSEADLRSLHACIAETGFIQVDATENSERMVHLAEPFPIEIKPIEAPDQERDRHGRCTVCNGMHGGDHPIIAVSEEGDVFVCERCITSRDFDFWLEQTAAHFEREALFRRTLIGRLKVKDMS